LSLIGTPYDYSSLFKQVLSRVSVDAHRLFCSEYWYFCWQKAGVPFSSNVAPRPGDLKDSTILQSGVKIL